MANKTGVIIITQDHYGNIEIDNTEKDHIQIWCHDQKQNTSEVIHIELDKLSEVIKSLSKCRAERRYKKSKPLWP